MDFEPNFSFDMIFTLDDRLLRDISCSFSRLIIRSYSELLKFPRKEKWAVPRYESGRFSIMKGRLSTRLSFYVPFHIKRPFTLNILDLSYLISITLVKMDF